MLSVHGDINNLKSLNNRRKSRVEVQLNTLSTEIKNITMDIEQTRQKIFNLKSQVLIIQKKYNQDIENNVVDNKFIHRHQYALEQIRRDILAKETKCNELTLKLTKLLEQQKALQQEMRKLLVKQEKYEWLLSA